MDERFFEEDRNLSASETIIMKAVWDAQGDIATQELIKVLRTQYGKDYARTTVVTFLLKLSDKGFVRTYRQGKLSYVHAMKSEDEYKAKLLREETDFWFQGKVSKLVSALCSVKKLTKEEAAEIRSILDDTEADNNH